eukprot:1107010-Rhodomonas_salina.3
MLVALSKRINAPEGGYRNQTAAMRPQWVNYFDARVATTIIRCMDAACPVSALAHSLSIDPLVSRDEFFSHVFGEVESPPEVRKGNCFRLQLVPSLIQKTVGCFAAASQPAKWTRRHKIDRHRCGCRL